MISIQKCIDCGEDHYLVTYLNDGMTMDTEFTIYEIWQMLEADKELNVDIIIGR